MTNSDKSFETVDEDAWSIYEKDIEEIVVDSYSEEDIEDDICIEVSTKPLAKDKEYERRKNINNMYTTIQKLLGGSDADEPRVKTLKRATDTCKGLGQEELQLKYETELLLQTNWKLKRRMEKLQRKKKRKTGPATISRRLSGPMVSSPVKTSPIEKRSASVDESKLVIIQNIPTETTTSTVIIESSKVPSPLQKNPKRKVKKRSGLSEEEKEFYKMEEKLEDLLYEIDALWNDVNNDEEKGSEFNDKKLIGEVHQADIISIDDIKPSGPSNAISIPQQKEKIKLADINKLIEPELNPNKHREGIKVNNISPLIGGESSVVKNVEVFKITNLNKLLDPVQNPILKTCDNASFQNINLPEKRKSSTSGDESPKLVIDENPQVNEGKNNLNQRELDVMEALQAVDTLCLSLVSDEPTTSESHPMVVEIKKIAKELEKTDVIAISDSDDETANSDIVCLE